VDVAIQAEILQQIIVKILTAKNFQFCAGKSWPSYLPLGK